MKINEVETLVGITKKNIRFYEAQGLLTPQRNSENHYRDYGSEEVSALRRIKLLRKLGVPLEEIRAMQSGVHTVGEGMRRHLAALEQQQRDRTQSILLCRQLTDCAQPLCALDAESILGQMAALEQTGTSFQNKQRQDIRTRYLAPVVAALVMVALMLASIALMLWAFAADPAGAPPLPLLVILLAIPAVMAGGVLLALAQRLREIDLGEEEDAKHY